MKEYRSISQILFGFLPEQTADLRGGVWKVREWQNAQKRAVDQQRLKKELRKQAAPWAIKRLDDNYVNDLMGHHHVTVCVLNRSDGVKVDPFPEIWMCKSCSRIVHTPLNPCHCGHRHFGQLPFVGYHDACGAIRAPFIPRCPRHNDVEIRFPGTASAAEIEFLCPICGMLLRKGFGFAKCDCGGGPLKFTVHRAASVYTPRTFVMVNPPLHERTTRLLEAGGAPRALSWIISGMESRTYEEAGLTKDILRHQLLANGLSEKLVNETVERIAAAGELNDSASDVALTPDKLGAAEEEAVTVALALSESRMRISDLDREDLGARRQSLYRQSYQEALRHAGLESIELIDRFPILTGAFGYTRGGPEPGTSRLVPFRDRRDKYVVYADVVETEALFVRLRPSLIASWLRTNGFELKTWSDERSARIAILQAAEVPGMGDQKLDSTAGTALLTLIHSFAHRFLRLLAVYAGLERNSLSEFLVPLHGAFFIYAASRGDFVLGGLQAVFESELDRFLGEFYGSETRCPLDPGCTKVGGACIACLHIGEPSCRYYNRFLDRRTLTDHKRGYLQVVRDSNAPG